MSNMSIASELINTYYKSVSVRTLETKRLRETIFRDTKFIPESTLMRFDSTGEFQPHIQTKCIYYRDSTNTWVWTISDTTGAYPDCILKIYRIRENKKSPESNESSTELTGNGENYQLEVRFLRMFSYMARNGVSPHVVLPIGHTIFSELEVRNIVKKRNQKVPEGQYMVLLSECATSSFYVDILHDILSPYNLKVILFQVVYTLMVIQDVFPSFRHNDLHLSNVLTQEFKVNESKTPFDIYEWSDTDRIFIDLSRAPRRALLWDMYFSSISKEDAMKFDLQNDHIVPTNWVKTRHCTNNYYDMHKFFDSLEYTLKGKNAKGFQEERKLIDTIVPESLKCLSKNKTRDEKKRMKLWDKCIMRPIDVLQLPYFQELYQVPEKNNSMLIKKYCPVARLKSTTTK